MKKNRIEKRTIVELAVTGFSGIVFLLYFSYMTSPLFPWAHGWDSAFFQLVGAGMTKGYLPYRDFFDMKGPWLFFIEYAAESIWYGRTGVFLMQCIWLCSVLFLCQRIFKKYFSGGGLGSSLVMIIPLFVVLSSTMEGGNLTEEWSLPFLFLSLYLALDFITGEKEEHMPWHGFIYGMCFGVITLIRVINAVMIGAIVLTVSFYLVKNRRWKNWGQNIAMFLLGPAAAFLPPFLYFGYYGEIRNMLYCVFVFGYIYGTEGFGIGAGGFFLLTLLFPIGVFLVTGQRNRRLWMLVLWNTAGMMITLGMGNSSFHDYIIVIPGMMLGVWRIIEVWRKRRMSKRQGWLAIAVIALCFSYPCYKMAGAGLSILRQAGDDTMYRHVKETEEYIPAEERNWVWGYEVPLRWYTITDIMPYSRYCGWQEHYMQLSESIEAEIKEMFEEQAPKWIVTKTSAVIENDMVKEQLRDNYEVVMENEDCRLYRQRQRMD